MIHAHLLRASLPMVCALFRLGLVYIKRGARKEMGTASSVLRCPKGYDPEKFKKICKLFDKLDADSNMGVSSDELTSIADLHVKNCIMLLNRRLEAEDQSVKRTVQELEAKCQEDISRVKYDAEVAKQGALRQSKSIKVAIQQKVDMYKGLDEDARENVFMKVLMPKDSEHIDFWTFFEYMKSRTDDIDNIES